jgi:hypothetical protein
MKNPFNNKKMISGLLLAMLCGSLFSCKKTEDAQAPAPPTPMGAISFHIHSNIDTSEVMLMSNGGGMAVKDASGRNIELDTAQFYISGITLKKADGTTLIVPKVYILKSIGLEDYMIGSVPAGNYTAVSFNVGIDPATNATLPSSYPSTSVLSPQKPSMWFSPTQGYVFMNIQGKVDTSAKNNGSVNFPISYKIGGNDLLKTINLPARTLSVVANGNERIHLIADYAKLLNGVNFKIQNNATPWSNKAVAVQMASQIPLMFKYEY